MRGSVIVRSGVPIRSAYGQYREDLRRDFFCSCCYCTIAECEAQAISFEIDHYKPSKKFPELSKNYTNLMYSCRLCNRYKGDVSATPEQEENGDRFVKMDVDVYVDHFDLKGAQLSGKTNIGTYSIAFLNLNRPTLVRLREIRRKLYDCLDFTRGGVFQLRNYRIDRLPERFRARALELKGIAEDGLKQLEMAVTDLLLEFASSELYVPPERQVEHQTRQEKNRAVPPEYKPLRREDWSRAS